MSNDNAEPTPPPAYGPPSTPAEPSTPESSTAAEPAVAPPAAQYPDAQYPAAQHPNAQYPVAPPQPYGQPQYAQQPYGQQPYYGAVPARPQGMSITALVCGLVGVFLSLFSFGFLPAVAGVIFGHIAQKRESYAKPLWLTGLITGYVGIGISLIWGLALLIPFMILLFAFPASMSFS